MKEQVRANQNMKPKLEASEGPAELLNYCLKWPSPEASEGPVHVGTLTEEFPTSGLFNFRERNPEALKKKKKKKMEFSHLNKDSSQILTTKIKRMI